jgi:hypothetical protein
MKHCSSERGNDQLLKRQMQIGDYSLSTLAAATAPDATQPGGTKAQNGLC